jgi:hypothetical protein
MLAGEDVDDLNARLVAAQAFFAPGDGRLKRPFNLRHWTGLGPTFVRESRRFPTRPFPAEETRVLLDHLRDGHPAVIEVDMYPAQDGQQQHFVLGVGAYGSPGAEQVVIRDPWHGDEVTLCPRYGTTLARALVGAVYFHEVK